MKTFKSARKSLASLDSDAAARAVAAAADVALVVDARGVIRDSAFGSDELAAALPEDLGGAAWQDIVSPESRPKVAALLEEGRGEGSPRWRQLNHLAAAGPVPVLYRAVPAGGAGRVLAVGRDLRPMAALQHRLVEAEQSIERDYARVRHAEARYRQLFQIASEPVVIIEAESRRVARFWGMGHTVGALPVPWTVERLTHFAPRGELPHPMAPPIEDPHPAMPYTLDLRHMPSTPGAFGPGASGAASQPGPARGGRA